MSSGRSIVTNGSVSLPPVDDAGHEVHRRRADEAGDEHVDRPLVQLARRGDLLEHALAQHGDTVAERHRLGLVVGDVDRGRLHPAVHPQDLGAHLAAQLGVEVRQRLVEQEGVGVAHDRTPHRHSLTLATREVGGLAVEVLTELEHVRCRFDLAS